jgi:hypothetical protein
MGFLASTLCLSYTKTLTIYGQQTVKKTLESSSAGYQLPISKDWPQKVENNRLTHRLPASSFSFHWPVTNALTKSHPQAVLLAQENVIPSSNTKRRIFFANS